MPTRRTLELVVITVILVQPVLGMVKLWAIKTMATTRDGSILHAAAEIGSVVL
jgi:hypothetical protein